MRYPEQGNHYEEAIYAYAYGDGHERREPVNTPNVPEVYDQGYLDGFKAQAGLTAAVEHADRESMARHSREED